MSGLKDRIKKEKEAAVTPTEKAVLSITGKSSKKDKYPVNVIFDGDQEQLIRDRAKELGLGVATYIKMLVHQDINER